MTLCNPKLRDALLTELLELNYQAFLTVVAEVLRRMGYEDVTYTSRTNFKGKHGDAGCDLIAYKPVPGGRRRVIVQVKQYAPDRPIFRPAIDYLRGVALRAGGAEVLLVTTSRFSKSISATFYASAPDMPVRLIDGAYLADQMALYRVGVVKQAPSGSPGSRWQLDRRFFAMLKKRRAWPGQPEAARRLRCFLVTVSPRSPRA